jgi:exodeoxyribonuclease V alpha subunit
MTPSGGPTPTWAPTLAAALAEALPRLHGVSGDPLIGELIAALSDALASGELLVDLTGAAPEAISSEGWPQAHRRSLAISPLAAEPDGPLVLVDGHRLMWRRWQQQRQRVLTDLIARARRQPDPPQTESADDTELLAPLDGRQRQAVRALAHHGLVLLEGGPGTGKTSTVAAMIAAARAAAPDRRIEGRVVGIAPASGALFSLLPPENATGNFTKIVQRFPVRISIERAQIDEGFLRAGMSVVTTIDTRP